MDSERKYAAPYVAFSTFETALDKLGKMPTLPPKIDHTVFTSMAGAAKTQVIGAFRYLGLIDDNGVPSTALKDLAKNKEGRKDAVRLLIENHYPNISADELAGASPSQIDAKLADKGYNVNGDTRQKARSFLIKAAEFAGMPISPLLKARGPRGPRKGAKRTAVKLKPIDYYKLEERKPNGDEGTKKTINLNSGGTVTVSLDVNLLELKGNDRKFVFELIDKLTEYEEALPK
jgi:hypothetical protein